jgi:hypothetical protein
MPHKPGHDKDFLKGFFGNKISTTRDKQNEAYQKLLKKKPKK